MRKFGVPLCSILGCMWSAGMVFHWCCYIIVDFATAASQNGFSTYKLSLHNKTNTFQKITKNISLLSFIIEQSRTRSLHSTFVELCKNHFAMRPLQNPPLCNRTVSLLKTTIDAHCYSKRYWLPLCSEHTEFPSRRGAYEIRSLRLLNLKCSFRFSLNVD